MKNILIIGFGKTGSHLYHALKAGSKLAPAVIKDKREFKNKAPKLINNADVIFICVKDSQIAEAVQMILGLKVSLKKKIFYHTSGALTSDELIALKNNGAYTASFHPVQSFAKGTGKYSGTFEGIYVAIEGDNVSVKYGRYIAGKIGSKVIVLNRESKIYHHICCVMSSNFLSALNYKVEETGLNKIRKNMISANKAGGKRIQKNGFKNGEILNIYKPLAIETINNGALLGAAGSLTGPIERFDLVTIKAHLDTLKKTNKGLLMFYILMGIETIKPALKKKSINKNQSAELYKLFSNYIIKQ